MSAAQQLYDRLLTAEISPEERARFNTLRATIPGWSDLRHYVFFRSLSSLLAPRSSLLILGVYHGLDIAIARAAGVTSYIVGVDKFNDEPCADWPPAWRDRSWDNAVGAQAPTLAAAHDCLQTAGALPDTLLVQSDDAAFLASGFRPPTPSGKYDCIYLDTAHDRATVERQIRQIRDCQLLGDNGILAGDDWDNLEPTWGVRDAVAAELGEVYVVSHRIWFCDAARLTARSGQQSAVSSQP